jgi:hypothetical protein
MRLFAELLNTPSRIKTFQQQIVLAGPGEDA